MTASGSARGARKTLSASCCAGPLPSDFAGAEDSPASDSRESLGRPATPRITSSSVVSVPVLSKQQISTFPAAGMRKGSVQKIPNRASAISDVLTASESSMGSSGGTTEVMIRVQLRSNLYLKVNISILQWTSIFLLLLFRETKVLPPPPPSKSSFYLLRVTSFKPSFRTYAAAASAKMSRKRINTKLSHVSAVTRSDEKRMVRMSRP